MVKNQHYISKKNIAKTDFIVYYTIIEITMKSGAIMDKNQFYNLGTSKSIYHIVKDGRVDLLQEIYVDDLDLLESCNKTDDFNLDIMARIADDGDKETLEKIIDAYFNEGSFTNNRNKKEFLLSHQIGRKPKDFHYFKRYLPMAEQIAFDEITGVKTTVTDENRTEKDEKMAELYYFIRDEYEKSSVREFSKSRRPNPKFASTTSPKGVYVNEIQFPGKEEGTSAYMHKEVYPNIVLENFVIDENGQNTGMVETVTISSIPYNKDSDLAKEVFKSINFPEKYLQADFFKTLQALDKGYRELRNSSEFSGASTSNFFGAFVIQNACELNPDANTVEDVGYGGYSDGKDVVITTAGDENQIKSILRHELAHHTDKSFSKSDTYKIASTMMYADRSISARRNVSVAVPLMYYPPSQYTNESLARVMESHPDKERGDDALLDSVGAMFNLYGKALAHDMPLSRFDTVMQRQLPNYEKYSFAYDVMVKIHNEIEPEQGFVDRGKELSDRYVLKESEFHHFIDIEAKLTEQPVIDAIDNEVRAIEKIMENPIAMQVILDESTLLRDNPNRDEPLEVMLANVFAFTKKECEQGNAQKSDVELLKKINNSSFDRLLATFEQDQANNMPLNRFNLTKLVSEATTINSVLTEVTKRHFPSISGFDVEINNCIPNEYTDLSQMYETAQNISDNLEMVNSKDDELRINKEIVTYPNFNFKTKIQEVDENFQTKDLHQIINNFSNNDFSPGFLSMTSGFLPGHVSNLRTAQNIYRTLNPDKKTIPDDLKFSNLTLATMDNDDGETEIAKTLTKYAAVFFDQYVEILEKTGKEPPKYKKEEPVFDIVLNRLKKWVGK